MRSVFVLFLSCSFLLIFSCSDGDVIDFEFDFDDEFRACGESELLLFKTKEDPSETVSVLILNYTVDEIFSEDEENDSLVIEKTNVRFTYRTYDRIGLPDNDDLFCASIPAEGLNIVIDENDETATATIIRVLTEDDNDGIPSELEGPNGIDPLGDTDNDRVPNYLDDNSNDNSILDANGMIEEGFDTDGDGLPNFIDEDDDGDNVLTKNENPDPDDNGELSDALDTDGDGTPDYLDADDDGDGVLTRDEENDTQNQNPLDDITNSDIGPDYINPNVSNTIAAVSYREHDIIRTYVVRLIVSNINISFLGQDELDFGVLTGESNLSGSRVITPDFP
ncbi:hypothetical protein [Hyunsoonleella pacifica]|uniref:Calcium-binding protein n=1 Tax=Hyunsoonleella pacifica TaxID=1080224 RepID=A0A4Q9FSP0_9FLAO|nr:hypothetical protein [Hyunsoonleella pacifica]TBN17876.1 hypothetical protein EYD46_06070 [Hyunsoonleella pacifica]GGD08153.1 hypothetical protein GCM10011368_07660 [Hyunsoonleella pacifica]